MTNEDRKQNILSIFYKKYEKELHQFDNYIGTNLWRVYPIGTIETWVIEKIEYRIPYFFGKVVSREFLKQLTEFIELPFDEDKLIFHVKSVDGKWVTSTGTTHKKILNGEFFQDKSEAEKDSEKKKYEMILRDGNHWCRYCHKQKPESEMEYVKSYDKEFYRSGPRNTKHVRFKDFYDWFCKGGCSTHYEWAQDG